MFFCIGTDILGISQLISPGKSPLGCSSEGWHWHWKAARGLGQVPFSDGFV